MTGEQSFRVLLNDNEMQLLREVACGYTNQEIAQHTKKSTQTVNNVVSGMCRTLRLRNRTELAVFAMGLGLVDVSDAWGDVRSRIMERANGATACVVEV
jgi:DNA-binding NarL/FixJ family response regulator